MLFDRTVANWRFKCEIAEKWLCVWILAIGAIPNFAFKVFFYTCNAVYSEHLKTVFPLLIKESGFYLVLLFLNLLSFTQPTSCIKTVDLMNFSIKPYFLPKNLFHKDFLGEVCELLNESTSLKSFSISISENCLDFAAKKFLKVCFAYPVPKLLIFLATFR